MTTKHTATGTSARIEEDHLNTRQIRRRAVTGAAVDALRGFGVRVIGLLGTLVLARLLTPRDFGIIAVGATFVTFANFIADGGVGAVLIRQSQPPMRSDLRALLAFQLGLTSVLAIGIGALFLPFGEIGAVTALMVVSLPLTAVRSPGVILLERRLDYRPLALVEIVETVFYYGWAITTVSKGWGVWGLASASVFRAIVGSSMLLCIVPAARMFPLPSWTKIRPLLGFGFRIQAVGIANLIRDLGTNAAIAIIAGVPALGIWTIAYRLLQIPLLFQISLSRVSFPGMSRLVSAGEPVGPTIERVVAVVAVASGVIIVPLVAATPAWVPSLLGSQWTDVVPVIPPAALHLMVMGPLTVAFIGYLWAVGEASAVLRATVASILTMGVVMIPLLAVIGVPAVGFGWLASGVAEATILIMCARKHAQFTIAPRMIPPTMLAVLAASAGWLVSREAGDTAIAGLAGALTGVVLYLALLWISHRNYLLDSIRLSARGLQGVLRKPAAD